MLGTERLPRTAVDVFIASTKPWSNLEAKQKHKQTKENEKSIFKCFFVLKECLNDMSLLLTHLVKWFLKSVRWSFLECACHILMFWLVYTSTGFD